jgi:putative ABC transport system substrate-binding protein
MRASEFPRLPGATGVFLEFPPEVEFQWLKRLLPGSRRVGVLYSAQNEAWVGGAERAARAAGLELVALRVNRPADLPHALDAITRGAEVLLGVADPLVLTPETARTVLLASLRERVPFVGMSGPWVRAGAFYALDRDYDDVGRQCGAMAASLLRGQGTPPRPEPPRKVLYSINGLTAEHLRITVSPDILGKATEVIR